MTRPFTLSFVHVRPSISFSENGGNGSPSLGEYHVPSSFIPACVSEDIVVIILSWSKNWSALWTCSRGMASRMRESGNVALELMTVTLLPSSSFNHIIVLLFPGGILDISRKKYPLEKYFGMTVSMRSSCACPVIATRANIIVIIAFFFIIYLVLLI